MNAATAASVAFLTTSVDELCVLVFYFAKAREVAPGGLGLSTLDVCLGNLLGFSIVLSASATGLALSALGSPYLRALGVLPMLVGLRTLVKRGRKWLRRRAASVLRRQDDGGASAAGLLEKGDAGVAQGEAVAAEGAAAAAPERDLAEGTAAAPGREVLMAGASVLPIPRPPPATCSPAIAAAARFVRPGLLEVCAVTLAGGAEEVAAFLPILATAGSALHVATILALLVGLALLMQALAASLVRCRSVAKAIEDYGEAVEPWAFIGLGVYITCAG